MSLLDLWQGAGAPAPAGSLVDLWYGGKPTDPQERLRAFRSRYPGAMPGLNEKVAQNGDTAVQRQGFLEKAGEYQQARRRSLLDTWQSGLWDLTQIPETLMGLQEGLGKALLPKRWEGAIDAANAPARTIMDALTPAGLDERVAASRQEMEVSKLAKAEAGMELGLPDALQVTENFGEDFLSVAADPLELLPGGLAMGALRGAGRARKAGRTAETVIQAGETWYDPGGGRAYEVLEDLGDRLRVRFEDGEEGVVHGMDFEGVEGRAHRKVAPAPGAGEEGAVFGLPAGAPPENQLRDFIDDFDERYFDREIPKAGLKDRLVEMGQKLRFELEDEYQPIVRMARETRDPEKVQLVEELVQQVRGAPVRSEIPVLRQTMRFDPATGEDAITGGSLMDVMKGHSEEALLDAERLMAAQRNLELADRVATGERLKVSPESVRDSQDLLTALSAKYGSRLPEVQAIADGYRDWSRRAFLEPLQGVGVLTGDAVAQMLQKGEQYTIFRRVEQMMKDMGIDLSVGENLPKGSGKGGGGGPLAGSPVKRIHGGLSEEEKLTGIFESSALQAMRIQRFVDRQHVKNILGEMADQFPGEVPIRRLPKVQRPVAAVDGETIFRAQEQGQGFIRYEDGQRIEYDAPADVLDALGRLTPKQALSVLAPARFATRLLRAGAVENPAFATFNALRDVVQSAVYSRAGMIPGYDVARVGARELASRVQGAGPTPAWRVTEEYSGFSGLMDVDRQAVRTLQKDAARLGTPGGAAKRFLREWKTNPLLPLQALSSLVERLPRLAEADLIMQGGRKTVGGLPVPGTLGKGAVKPSRRAAGTAASEVTLNFSRGGRAGKSWNRYEAFANAMLQDASKFARELRQRPFETTVRSLAFIGVPAAINYALNKDDPEYAEIPEWEKALFYHPGKAPNGWWVRIPRPLGLPSVVFGYGLEKTLQALQSDDPRQLDKVLEGLSASTALGYVSQPLDLLPSAVQPAVEAHPDVNYSAFRERPVVPRSRELLPATEQIGPYTSPSMVDLGSALSVSPERLQYVYESHTGTLGREGLSIVDALRGDKQERLSSPKDIPILGRFFSRPAQGSASVSVDTFYDLSDKVEGAWRLASQDPSRAREYVGEVEIAPAFRKVRSMLSELRKVRSAILDSPSLSDKQKRLRLDKIEKAETRLAKAMVDLYDEKATSP